jgi:hypothetical protein
MSDDIEIVDDVVDAVFFVNETELSTDDVMRGVDMVLEEIRRTGEFERGTDAVRSMHGVIRAAGWASAKLIHGMKKEWLEQGRNEDRFLDYMQDMTPLKRLIIDRYLRAWDAQLHLPQLLTQPIKNGIALGAALAQGYELDDEQLEKLASAKSNQEFLGIIREVKGKEPRKGSLTIYLEKNGSLQAWQGDDTRFVGDLDISSKDPMIMKAVERIVTSSGIIKRG